MHLSLSKQSLRSCKQHTPVPPSNLAAPSFMYVTRAGSTLQGTTVCVAEQIVVPTFIAGVVVQFQLGSCRCACGGCDSWVTVTVFNDCSCPGQQP